MVKKGFIKEKNVNFDFCQLTMMLWAIMWTAEDVES